MLRCPPEGGGQPFTRGNGNGRDSAQALNRSSDLAIANVKKPSKFDTAPTATRCPPVSGHFSCDQGSRTPQGCKIPVAPWL
jgi:hypothetical protein